MQTFTLERAAFCLRGSDNFWLTSPVPPLPLILLAALLLVAPGFAVAATAAPAADGNSPLHRAALQGDVASVESLLAAGADANATNAAGATALHYATGSPRMVRALLAAGARANTVSAMGVTPLATAATRDGASEAVGLLLEAGADANAALPAREGSLRPLTLAVFGGDARSVELLLQHEAAVNVEAGLSPLAAAAFVGDAGAAERFLDLGAKVNHDSGFAGTPLNFAFYSGHPQVASLLLEFGASLRAPSAVGYATPPMVWAAYGDDGDPRFARELVARGVDVNTKNENGETALSFALRRAPESPLVAFLRSAGAKEPSSRPKTVPQREVPPDGPARQAAIVAASQKAVALLQRSSDKFLGTAFVRQKAQCISCHQQTLPAMTLSLARDRGLSVDEASLGRQLAAQVAMIAPRVEHARQMMEPVSDSPVSLGYGFDALNALGFPADETTTAMSGYLINAQRVAGFWPALDRRPPMEDGPLVGTAWAVRAIQLYPPRGREQAAREALQRARAWIERQTPRTHNERVFQLFGLIWSGQPRSARRPLMEALAASQRPDGGWSQLPGLPSDAWATGSALVALQNSGFGTWEPVYQRGVEFLLRTQFDDGSWWVRSRSWPFQPHFESDFPHGRDQWISAAGTAWATSALLLTVPRRNGRVLPNAPELMSVSHSAPASDANIATAEPASVAGSTIDFARDIRPLLERSCLDCHGEKKPRGGFSLRSREAVLKGGNTGEPAVVPGRSTASHLLRYVSDQVEDLEMPPLRRRDEYPALTNEEVERLRKWIDDGAVWGDNDPGRGLNH